MTDKKICVYAICKNESEWINRWLDNMSEADYIVVLDTGSTDGSFELLKKDSRVTRVEQKVIEPWRFDVARNESMKLIPDDVEICVCTDFDEIFEKGWCNVLRENWEDNDTRCHYMYAWSHNSNGEPTNVFTYDKIHTKNYHWKYPVHEILEKNDPNMEENILDAGENIYLHHFMDTTKARSSYLPLLKIAVKENPKDSHVSSLLAREYYIAEDYDNSIKQYLKTLEYDEIDNEDKVGIKLDCIGHLGDNYFVKGEYDNAIRWYTEWIKLNYTYREPYFCIADVYMAQGLYSIAVGYIDMGRKFSTRKYDWLERYDNWIAKDSDLLSICNYYLGNIDEAYYHIAIAYEHNPDDERIINNYKTILFAKETGVCTNTVY